MANGQFAVIVQEKGSLPSLAIVGTGATVRSALMVKKLNPEANAHRVTLSRKGKTTQADLNTRVQTGDLLAITPDSAGGSR